MKKVIRLLLPGLALLIFAGLNNNIQAQEKAKKSNDVFVVVEDMPSFKAGDITEFKLWVAKQVVYPKKALKKAISGKVDCTFVIDENGNLGDIEITNSVDDLLGNEVKRVLKTSPKWTPGQQRSKAVKVKLSVPVMFNLDEKKK